MLNSFLPVFCLAVVFFSLKSSVQFLFSWNFQGCIAVHLSRFSAVSLWSAPACFPLGAPAAAFSGNSVIISQCLFLVNNILKFFPSRISTKKMSFCGGFSLYHHTILFVNAAICFFCTILVTVNYCSLVTSARCFHAFFVCKTPDRGARNR